MTTLPTDLERLTDTLTDVLGVPVTRDPGLLPGLVASYPVVVFIGPPAFEPTMTGGARLDFDCHVIRGGTGGLSDLDLDLETSTARARLNLANILDRAAQLDIRTLVVGPVPSLDNERNARLAELNTAYLDVADRRRHYYVDTFTPLVNHEQWRNDLAAGHGLPGQAGYGLIAWLVLHRGWYQWLGVPEPTA